MKTMSETRVPAEVRGQVVMTDADVRRLTRMLRGVEGPQNSLFGYAEALRGEMGKASVVPQREVPADVVTMNSRVKVRDVKTRKVETYVLVYPWEASMTEDGLSVLAPVGTALIGARAGDVVSCRVPKQERERALRVEGVLFQPEAAGQFEL
jgi:regulator of nucleoside diphosphate kinase